MSSIDWDQVYVNNITNQRDYAAFTTNDLSFLLGKLPKRNTALDIGCGTGQVCRDLFHRGFNVLGVDISKEAIKQARASTKYLGEGIDFMQCDIEADELPGELADLIVCKYTYAFFNDKELFIKKVLSKMHPDSLLIIILSSPQHVPDDKKHITVDCNEVMKELNLYFGLVEHSVRRHDDFYFCYS